MPPHLSLISGLLMGAADAIPGVSGGTIALVVGIYDRFIKAIATVVRTPKLVRTAAGRGQLAGALHLLVPIGIGAAISLLAVTRLLVGPSDDPGILLQPETAPICYGFFFGLVLVSIREPWRRIRVHSPSRIVAAVAGAAIAALFVALPHQSGTPPTWTLLLGGAGAISVMLLPGISGSLFLVILGQYALVTSALHDRDLGVLAIFIAGIGLGVVVFVPLLRRALVSYHDTTMAGLTGLMAGSLRALWPYKDNYQPKAGPMHNVGIGDDLVWVIVAAVAGGAVVWLLAQLERRIQAVDEPDAADAADAPAADKSGPQPGL